MRKKRLYSEKGVRIERREEREREKKRKKYIVKTGVWVGDKKKGGKGGGWGRGATVGGDGGSARAFVSLRVASDCVDWALIASILSELMLARALG